MVVKQSTISIATASIFLVLAVLLGAGVYLVSRSIEREQQAVGSQAESRQLGVSGKRRLQFRCWPLADLYRIMRKVGK